MRWSRFLLPCLLVAFSVVLQGQMLIDFSDAIDPAQLNPVEIYEQIDTVSKHRVPVGLAHLETEFIKGQDLNIQTYYQKSEQHQMIQLSQYAMPIDHLLVMVEGIGKTYFKISDEVCTITTVYIKDTDRLDNHILDRNCTL